MRLENKWQQPIYKLTTWTKSMSLGPRQTSRFPFGSLSKRFGNHGGIKYGLITEVHD